MPEPEKDPCPRAVKAPFRGNPHFWGKHLRRYNLVEQVVASVKMSTTNYPVTKARNSEFRIFMASFFMATVYGTRKRFFEARNIGVDTFYTHLSIFLYASIYGQKARKLVIEKSSIRGPVFVVAAWRGGVAWWSLVGQEYLKQHALTGKGRCGRAVQTCNLNVVSGRVVGPNPRDVTFRLSLKCKLVATGLRKGFEIAVSTFS